MVTEAKPDPCQFIQIQPQKWFCFKHFSHVEQNTAPTICKMVLSNGEEVTEIDISKPEDREKLDKILSEASEVGGD